MKFETLEKHMHQIAHALDEGALTQCLDALIVFGEALAVEYPRYTAEEIHRALAEHAPHYAQLELPHMLIPTLLFHGKTQVHMTLDDPDAKENEIKMHVLELLSLGLTTFIFIIDEKRCYKQIDKIPEEDLYGIEEGSDKCPMDYAVSVLHERLDTYDFSRLSLSCDKAHANKDLEALHMDV